MTILPVLPGRRIVAGFCLVTTLGLAAVRAGFGDTPAAGGKFVQPVVVVDNAKIKMVRWVLQPGEATPPQACSLDHVEVVIHGARIQVAGAEGKNTESVQEAGRAVFVPAEGGTIALANIGDTPYEMVWTDLKPQAGPATPVPNPPMISPHTLARLVTDKVVPAQILVDNRKIKMERWIFQPGECSPIHIHALDHIYIVVRGSKVREITGEGKTNDDTQETGRAAFSRARGKVHSFGNIGDARPYEMVSFELK